MMNYLDTNILGYAVENHPKYGSSCKKIIQDIQDGTLRAARSVLVLSELISVLKKINKELAKRKIADLDIRANIDAVLSLPITWLEIKLFIIKRAAEYTFPAPGALHPRGNDENSRHHQYHQRRPRLRPRKQHCTNRPTDI